MSTHNPPNQTETSAETSADHAVMTHASVMMIDDEPILIELVRAFLEEAGYNEFIGINDPETAMGSIQANKPDVLLLDLMMPKVNGFEILEQVRADADMRHLPVIVMTSASDAKTKLRVLEMGAADFLEKPVDPSELVLRLRNTLAFKAQRDRMIYFDALTNLPNRRLFMNQLSSAVRRNSRNQKICGVVHIDIDRVKQINETLGHRVGDAVVKIVAQRLQSCLAGVDPMGANVDSSAAWSLSRIGGAEFVALMPGLSRIEEAAGLARRVVGAMNSPVHVEEHELFVTTCIGIAASPSDGDAPDRLLQHANAALAAAKQSGSNTYSFFSADLNSKAIERLTLEKDVRKAIANQEFVLFYQPKVDVQTNQIVGAEALIRWNHPTRGMVSPNEFIPLAEELGLITEIGSWVIETACAEAVRWREAGKPDCTVSVNISPPHFYDGRLLQDVQSTLEATGLNPCMLMLEITESMMMRHTTENLLTLESLKTMGVRTSMDDFGTGFSSLTYLKRMRIDEIKIDRSFVAGVPDDAESAGIVRAVLAMSSSLGLDVTAEGVETEEQLEFLRDIGCRVYQGFLCSQPIPADRFQMLLMQEFNHNIDIEVGDSSDDIEADSVQLTSA